MQHVCEQIMCVHEVGVVLFVSLGGSSRAPVGQR